MFSVRKKVNLYKRTWNSGFHNVTFPHNVDILIKSGTQSVKYDCKLIKKPISGKTLYLLTYPMEQSPS